MKTSYLQNVFHASSLRGIGEGVVREQFRRVRMGEELHYPMVEELSVIIHQLKTDVLCLDSSSTTELWTDSYLL